MRDGDILSSTCNGDFVIVKVTNSRDVRIRFIDTGFEKGGFQAGNLRLGRARDPMRPEVEGVGYVSEGTYSRSKTPKVYEVWRSMLKRCYNEEYRFKFPTYVDVLVCTEWLNLQTFGSWFTDNYIEGYELDKDKVGNGKLYSPDTCVFISKVENVTLSNLCSKVRKLQNLVTKEIVEVTNQSAFSKSRGLNKQCISRLIRGTQKTHRGWVLYVD